jgi:hypothetical protein
MPLCWHLRSLLALFEIDTVDAIVGAVITMRRMAQGIDLMDVLGSGVVSIEVQGRAAPVTAIHLWGERSTPTAGSLIIGIGLSEATSQCEAIEMAANVDAAGVVVAVALTSEARNRARELAVTVVALNAGTDWSLLIWLVRSLLTGTRVAVGNGGLAQQSLFALADAVGTTLNAPVTIEDAHSCVVAHSVTTEDADQARTSTIMSRAVPGSVLRRLRATGVLRRLSQDRRPFTVSTNDPEFRKRLVVPLHIGGQPVGSIWAIWDGALTAELEEHLAGAGATAASLLVQLRAQADIAGRYSVQRLRAALLGDDLDLRSALPLPAAEVRVVALKIDPAGAGEEGLMLWRTFLRKKSWADPMLADVDGVTFAVVAEHADTGGWEWLSHLAKQSCPGVVAASRPVSRRALPCARREALEVLSVLSASGGQVASQEDVWDAIVLARAEAAVGTVVHQRLRSLLDADVRDGTHLAQTLRVLWECHGDVPAAARVLHVHPNTVRLRVRRAEPALSGSVTTPAQRLAAVLLLRAWSEAD